MSTTVDGPAAALSITTRTIWCPPTPLTAAVWLIHNGGTFGDWFKQWATLVGLKRTVEYWTPPIEVVFLLIQQKRNQGRNKGLPQGVEIKVQINGKMAHYLRGGTFLQHNMFTAKRRCGFVAVALFSSVDRKKNID